jgi:hypothetical protein
MALTLDTVALPDELHWQDEFTWNKKTHSKAYGITGALFVQVGTKETGRDITLVGTESMWWVTRDVIEDLQTLRDTDPEMTLTLQDSRTFTVMFKQDEECIDVEPIIAHNQYEASGYYKINAIRLFQIPTP